MNMEGAEEKKRFVREKFSSISKEYDLLNTLLSFNIDRYWRWVATRMLREFPDGSVLDLCAGTLPLSLELARQAPRRQVLAVDFCEDMLRAGGKRLARDARRQRILPVCGDGEKIPVAENSVCGITVGFGVRNNSRTMEALREMHRVLVPGGKLLILEFSRPRHPVVKPVYNFYLNRMLPRMAGLISGDQEAYEYLASSIAKFYEPEELLRLMRHAGFAEVRRRPLTFGIVSIYVGVK